MNADMKNYVFTEIDGRANEQAKVRVVVWVGLSDKKCLEKLRGLDACELVEGGLVFRRYPVKGLKKFRQINPPSIFRSSALLSHLYALMVTAPWCLRFRPHVCIGISLMPHSVMAKLGQAVCRSKFVTWFIGTDVYVELAQKWWGKLLRKPMANASCTLTMGSCSNKMLASMGWPQERLLVGRNDYDFSEYKETGAENEWNVIYTGRLDRTHKRLSLLLYALTEVKKSYPAIRCAIVGEGPDRKRLEEMCRSLGLHSNVYFLGHRHDIPALLNRSRIIVMTSAWEGLPSSIVEAFALGLPVVSSNVGDISDVVDSGDNGFLVNSNNPSAYSEAILRILDHPELYSEMSKSAKQTGQRIRRAIERGESAMRWRQAIEKTLSDD